MLLLVVTRKLKDLNHFLNSVINDYSSDPFSPLVTTIPTKMRSDLSINGTREKSTKEWMSSDEEFVKNLLRHLRNIADEK